MTEDEFESEAEYLSDVVGWLLQADEKERRQVYLRHIQCQVEYMQEILEEDA